VPDRPNSALVLPQRHNVINPLTSRNPLVTQHHISQFRRPSLHRAPTLHRRDTDIENPNALRRWRLPALRVAHL